VREERGMQDGRRKDGGTKGEGDGERRETC